MTPIAENSVMVGATKSSRKICQCFARRKKLAIAFTFPQTLGATTFSVALAFISCYSGTSRRFGFNSWLVGLPDIS